MARECHEANIPDEWVEKVARSLYASSPCLYDVGYDKSPDKDVYDDAARDALAAIAEALTTAREQIAWTVERCNTAIGDGFDGTPNSAVAAVCDEIVRLREALTTATEALRAIAAPEHRMPDDWASMVAIAALRRIARTLGKEE